MQLTDEEEFAALRVAATRFADIRRAIGEELTKTTSVESKKREVLTPTYAMSWSHTQ